MIMDPVVEVLNDVRKKLTGVYEAYHVLTFELVRRALGNDMQVVRLEIFDEGPDPDPTKDIGPLPGRSHQRGRSQGHQRPGAIDLGGVGHPPVARIGSPSESLAALASSRGRQREGQEERYLNMTAPHALQAQQLRAELQ